jgi:hypothetical protein
MAEERQKVAGNTVHLIQDTNSIQIQTFPGRLDITVSQEGIFDL